jgi:hypothetical protein
MRKKAWCGACGRYVILNSAGICPVGHPRPALRALEDVPDDYVLPAPPSRPVAPEPEAPPPLPDDHLGGFPSAGEIAIADEIADAPMVLDESHRRRLVGIPILAALFLAVIVAGSILWLLFRESPAHCLAQVSIGVQEREWARVERYVDVESVAQSTVESAAADYTRNDPPSYVALISNTARLVSPYVAKKAAAAFKESVERGPSTTTASTGSLRDMLATMHVKSITAEGGTALAVVSVRGASGTPVDLRVRMRRGFFMRNWRITAIENWLDTGSRSASKSNLIPLHTSARLGDWTLCVVGVSRKPDDTPEKAGTAQSKALAARFGAPGQYDYLVVSMRATYHGTEPRGYFMRDLTPRLVTLRGTTSDSFPKQVPDRIERMTADRGGAGIRGNVYFRERTSDTKGVCMMVVLRADDGSTDSAVFALE